MHGRLVLVFALSACRMGFDEVETTVDPTMDGPSAKVRVTVLGTDEETRVGQPIADAYVIYVGPDGTSQTLRTASDGVVNATVLVGTAVVIARAAPEVAVNRWLLYSFDAIDTDLEVLVGSRAPKATSITMTANLPAFPDVAFTHSRIRGPMRCLPEAADTLGTTVVFEIDAACAGTSVPLFAQGVEDAPYIYMALGETTLAEGTAITPSGSWLDADKYDVEYTGLPPAVTELYGFVAMPGVTSSMGDAIIVDEALETPTAGMATLNYDGPPLVAGSLLGTAMSDGANGTRLILEPLDGGFGNRMFDIDLVGAAVSLPIANSAARTIAWTAEQDPDADIAGVQTRISTNGLEITWRAYGPGTTRELAYPELPAALASIIPEESAAWLVDGIAQVALSDFTYATVTSIIDRDIEHWAGSATYLPPGTLSISAAEAASTPRAGTIPALVDRVQRSLQR
jgi:hypothetical protein